ncbi:MAG: hypothetical protein JJ974_04365 [Phycisphaerales bacterium]|nr:hypothetical protein [Phycisphaerales bacterium]
MLKYFYLEMLVKKLSVNHPFGDDCYRAYLELFVPAENIEEAADKATDYLFEYCMDSGVIKDCYEPLDGEIEQIFESNSREFIDPSENEIVIAKTVLYTKPWYRKFV